MLLPEPTDHAAARADAGRHLEVEQPPEGGSDARQRQPRAPGDVGDGEAPTVPRQHAEDAHEGAGPEELVERVVERTGGGWAHARESKCSFRRARQLSPTKVRLRSPSRNQAARGIPRPEARPLARGTRGPGQPAAACGYAAWSRVAPLSRTLATARRNSAPRMAPASSASTRPWSRAPRSLWRRVFNCGPMSSPTRHDESTWIPLMLE